MATVDVEKLAVRIVEDRFLGLVDAFTYHSHFFSCLCLLLDKVTESDCLGWTET